MAGPPVELIDGYEAALDFLEDRVGLGVKPGLERISGLLDLMTNPHRSYRVVHVAGTNGKTTAVRMIAAILGAHGLRVGTFTSPHLRAVEERFTVSGREFGPGDFVQAVADVAPFVQMFEAGGGGGVTYFEATAAIAFQAFASAGVEVAVVEVGLGGRLDATNVVDADVAVITGIALDHQAYLGDTIAEIAAEKAAILGPGGLLVTGPLPPAAEGAVTARVTETGSRWIRFGDDFGPDSVIKAVGGWQGDFGSVHGNYAEVFLPLHGRHQVDHFATSIAASEMLLDRALDADVVRSAAARISSPGRIQVMSHSPLVVVDGAHNVEGLEGLSAALEDEFPTAPWTLVFGARGDRDVAAMLRPLRGVVAEVIATAPGDPAAIAAEDVASAATAVFGPDVPVRVLTPVSAAVTAAVEGAGGQGCVVVAGSLYVTGEAIAVLRGESPA